MCVWQVSDASGIAKIPEPTENIELFVFCPAPQSSVIQCRVTRDKKGVDRNMYPTYYLHMERSDGKRVCSIVCCLKAKFHQSSRTKAWSKTQVFDQAFVLLDRVCDLLTTSSELFVSKTWSKAC